MRLPSFDVDHYTLDDGEEIHKENTDTFLIPSAHDRENLKKGDIVKLIFRMEQRDVEELSIERMWVIVTDVKRGGYVGKIDNDPVGEVFLKADDSVEFESKHVIQIYQEEGGV